MRRYEAENNDSKWAYCWGIVNCWFRPETPLRCSFDWKTCGYPTHLMADPIDGRPNSCFTLCFENMDWTKNKKISEERVFRIMSVLNRSDVDCFEFSLIIQYVSIWSVHWAEHENPWSMNLYVQSTATCLRIRNVVGSGRDDSTVTGCRFIGAGPIRDAD